MTLTQYLAETATSQRAFAQQIEVSPGYLHDILHNRRTPSLSIAMRIFTATGGRVSLKSLVRKEG